MLKNKGTINNKTLAPLSIIPLLWMAGEAGVGGEAYVKPLCTYCAYVVQKNNAWKDF
jgi:hypothetical protein